MIHSGWPGSFPCDWSYHGHAKLLIGNATLAITVDLSLAFLEEAEIDVKLIWSGVSESKRFEIDRTIEKEKQHTLVIQRSILLIGYFTSPLYANNEITEFKVQRVIRYSTIPENIVPIEGPDPFVQMRAYLNDEFSGVDYIFTSEIERISRKIKDFQAEQYSQFYCALNSGYGFYCGKKYVTHKSQGSFSNKNINTLYKLSFVDVKLPINSPHVKKIIGNQGSTDIAWAEHLESVLNEVCAFLSILCDYEILPIYYDYSVYVQGKFIDGQIIPIGERKINRITKSRPRVDIHFLGNVEDFLECCPLDKQLSRGIWHLKVTIYQSTIELKLMAACSAIEYFYAYWFWNMNGVSKLINAHSQNNSLVNLSSRDIKDLQKWKPLSNGKTLSLSTVIRFFMDDLGIDWHKYMNSIDYPKFIQVRNELLHGSFTSNNNDIEIFQAEEVAQQIAREILFSIMKKISKSNNKESYTKLPVPPPNQDFFALSDGWAEIQSMLNDLRSNKKGNRFWSKS